MVLPWIDPVEFNTVNLRSNYCSHIVQRTIEKVTVHAEPRAWIFVCVLNYDG